jgi:hypothetical protein
MVLWSGRNISHGPSSLAEPLRDGSLRSALFPQRFSQTTWPLRCSLNREGVRFFRSRLWRRSNRFCRDSCRSPAHARDQSNRHHQTPKGRGSRQVLPGPCEAGMPNPSIHGRTCCASRQVLPRAASACDQPNLGHKPNEP